MSDLRDSLKPDEVGEEDWQIFIAKHDIVHPQAAPNCYWCGAPPPDNYKFDAEDIIYRYDLMVRIGKA